MNAPAGVQVRERTCDVRGEADPQPPRERLGLVPYILPDVPRLDEFGNNEYSAVRIGRAGKTEVEDDVRMAGLFEQAPLALKVLSDVVLGARKNLLDRDVDAQIFACPRRLSALPPGRDLRQGRAQTLVDIPERARAQLLPVTRDVLHDVHNKQSIVRWNGPRTGSRRRVRPWSFAARSQPARAGATCVQVRDVTTRLSEPLSPSFLLLPSSVLKESHLE